MFDPRSSELLRSAPDLPELDSSELPQLLTRHYAELVSARLRSNDAAAEKDPADRWPLERLADVYEMVASLEEVPVLKRAAAFVAGTAQQILARKLGKPNTDPARTLITRDAIDPTISATLLFLAAEQYGDANEAAAGIPYSSGTTEVTAICANIRDLAKGRLEEILARAPVWRGRVSPNGTVQGRAFRLLISALNEGIEVLAAQMLSVEIPDVTPRRFSTPRLAFQRVLDLSVNMDLTRSAELGGELRTAYAGPRHLASLLIAATGAIEAAALTKLPAPTGGTGDFWKNWLGFRAKTMPFIWPNHRAAIAKNFYETGRSAVLVLPTGAGKTTVSALKIAGTLARGKKVVFLAPTHALVEQLTEDLQGIFPKEEFGLQVSSDSDSVMMPDDQLQDIEVMTPERCLAMLSFSADSFQNVGLLVFDECHLLSPESGKIGRALDGMLCLLTFSAISPDADMLFLSAMLKNGPEFADWIQDLTKKPCSAVDLLWKPSRQARGVVVYDQKEIANSLANAKAVQQRLDREEKKASQGLRSAAKKELVGTPHVVWGLRHNWLESEGGFTFTQISDEQLVLGPGYDGRKVWITPNANAIAATIAKSASGTGLKTIIFVNKKSDAISTANAIASSLNDPPVFNEDEKLAWDMLVAELGDARHTVFKAPFFGAVPHNATMLRLERTISEKLFKRSNGAKVIVATPTLAQGLNLPAHLAILAGDKRSSEKKDGGRESLEAHELLNAAARAGRAGHLANGVVILIPEPIIKFSKGAPIGADLQQKLSSVVPEDDRCVTISDPLEVVLDRVMMGQHHDRDVRYTVNRLAALVASDTEEASQDIIMARSMGAYLARKQSREQVYLEKVDLLLERAREAIADAPERSVVIIASQSGLPLDLLDRLRDRLSKGAGALPNSIEGWVRWTFQWLIDDALAMEHLLMDVGRSAVKSVGDKAESPVTASVLNRLLRGVILWLQGKPINQIEIALGGNPAGKSESDRMCSRAREMISTFIPRGLSFVVGVVARMVEELNIYDSQPDLDSADVQSLSVAVRRGFDTRDKLEFALQNRTILGRVHLHNLYADSLDIFDDEFDL